MILISLNVLNNVKNNLKTKNKGFKGDYGKNDFIRAFLKNDLYLGNNILPGI